MDSAGADACRSIDSNRLQVDSRPSGGYAVLVRFANGSAPGHYCCFSCSGPTDVIRNTECLAYLSLLVCNVVINRERSALCDEIATELK